MHRRRARNEPESGAAPARVVSGTRASRGSAPTIGASVPSTSKHSAAAAGSEARAARSPLRHDDLHSPGHDRRGGDLVSAGGRADRLDRRAASGRRPAIAELSTHRASSSRSGRSRTSGSGSCSAGSPLVESASSEYDVPSRWSKACRRRAHRDAVAAELRAVAEEIARSDRRRARLRSDPTTRRVSGSASSRASSSADRHASGGVVGGSALRASLSASRRRAELIPGATAQAWGVRVVVPGSTGGGTTAVSVPPSDTPVASRLVLSIPPTAR